MFISRTLFRTLPILAAAAATLGSHAVANADVLYSQPYLLTTNGAYFASEQAGVDAYDSFVLPASGTITSVAWSGFDLNELIPGTVLNPTSFDIDIYAASRSGGPGKLLSSSTIGNSGNAVSTGQMFEDAVTLYDYSGTLATPFQAAAGKTYWIEINDPTSNDDWFWATGAGPDGTHLGTFPGEGTQTYSDDLAFTLSNVSPVPEPSSWALLLLGSAGLLAIRAKRRASQPHNPGMRD